MAKGFKGKSPMGGMGSMGMMQQLQKLQEQMEQTQAQLAEETVTATAGGGAVAVTVTGDQRCKAITIDPELLPSATWDAESIFEAGTEGALSMVLSDGTAKCTIAAPKCQLMEPQHGTRGEKLIWDELEFQLNINAAADDEITFTMAAVT